jgi:hypothetical protein
MIKKRMVLSIVFAALASLAVVSAQAGGLGTGALAPSASLSTSFTYQGQLNLDGQPVDNTCDFQFSLYDDELGDVQVGVTQTITDVEVSGGLFAVQLDFGASAFQGDARWLGIQVQCQGDAEYVDLGLQALTATPYALYARGAPWDGVSDMPAGFADGVDDVSAVVSGTAIYAGEGLSQVGSGDAITLSITPSYRLPQTCADGQIAEWDGSAWDCGDDNTGGGGDYWSLTGNAGTDPATYFLGTSDGVSLTLAVSGTPALRLEPSGGTPNLIGGYSGNSVADGVVGATVGGGGDSDHPNQVMGDFAAVGGGVGNIASGAGSFIGGGGYGSGNEALGVASTIGGGFGNVVTTTGDYATIGGGQGNDASGGGTTVGGGGCNTAGNDYATVGGGWYNAASGSGATIPGGYDNTASGIGAFIGGGGYDGSTLDGNEALGPASTIGGGLGNVITTTVYYATIGGGSSNAASGNAATVGGGSDNIASSDWATVGGGYGHHASGDSATVGGGYGNAASGDVATVGGGYSNTASGTGAFIGGGGYDGSTYSGNEALGPASTIGGGLGNVVTATVSYATIGGGHSNTASGDSATVGGGYHNTASGWAVTIGGGVDNTASNWHATVGGGHSNAASGIGATIGGGGYDGIKYDGNEALGNASTIGGGLGNVITSAVYYSTIGGGHSNIASGGAATVGGGNNNTASGYAAAIPGGSENVAGGDYSVAAGRHAQANHDGAIILADSSDFDFASLVPNSFKVRATGGIRFVLGIDGSGDPTWSCLVQDGSSWSCSSDRSLKENLDLVDGGQILRRLAEVPIYTWNGQGQDPALRHMGPMAQDFYAAFGLGGDDTHIATIDLDGVALAAIQELTAENATLRERVDDLEARLSALESGGSATSPAQSGLLPGVSWLLVGAGLAWVIWRRGGER